MDLETTTKCYKLVAYMPSLVNTYVLSDTHCIFIFLSSIKFIADF